MAQKNKKRVDWKKSTKTNKNTVKLSTLQSIDDRGYRTTISVFFIFRSIKRDVCRYFCPLSSSIEIKRHCERSLLVWEDRCGESYRIPILLHRKYMNAYIRQAFLSWITICLDLIGMGESTHSRNERNTGNPPRMSLLVVRSSNRGIHGPKSGQGWLSREGHLAGDSICAISSSF